MANLLSWLGGAGKKIQDVAGGIERQINPFDNGATYNNAAPTMVPNRGITPLDVARQIPRATQQVGSGIYHGAINTADSLLGNVGHLADVVNYPINEGIYRNEMNAGRISPDTYLKLTADSANKAGFNSGDKGLTIARKVAGAVAGPTATILTADAAPKVLEAAKLSQRALAGASLGAKLGGTFGGISTLTQQGPITPLGAVGNIAGGAIGGGAIGAATPLAAAGINKLLKTAPLANEAGKVPISALPKEVDQTLSDIKVANPSKTKGAANELVGLFSPGKDTKVIQNDLRAATGNLALEKGQASEKASTAVKFFDKQAPQDNAKFIQTIEAGIKQPTPELQKLADTFRQGFDKDYKLAQTLKPDLPYVNNYFAQSGIWSDPKAAQAFVNKWNTPSLGGKPGALEQRTFPTIYDGIKAGLQLKETNPATIALNNHASLLKAKMAQDFMNEQAAKGVDPEIAQKVVDRYLQPGLGGSNVYKSAKEAGYALNNIQLGLSGFHVTGTALNAVFSGFSNGLQDALTGHPIKAIKDISKAPFAPLDYVLSGNKLIKDYKAGNITPDIKNIAEGGGRVVPQVEYQTTGLAKSLQDWNQGHKVSAVANAPLRAFSDAAKPIMEWWVPRIKAGAEKALIDRKLSELGANASPEAIRAAKSSAIDSIDNRFGQLTQDNLFWDKRLKDTMSLLMRSPGWNVGTVREVGGGAGNLLKSSTYSNLAKGKGLPENTAYTASLAAGTMLIGTAIQHLFTGKSPSSAIDYFYPKTGQTDKNGNEERVSLPTYAKDVFAFVHNPGQTIANKASPLLSEANQLRTNKNYYGDLIRNPQDSAGTQAQQLGDYLLKSNAPFSLQGANQRVDQSIGTKIQSFAGLNPAPGYITKSGFQQNVEGALNTKLGSTPRTPEEVALANKKSEAKQAAKFGDNSHIDELVRTGQLTSKQGDNLKQQSSNTSLQNQFSYLLKVDKEAAGKLIASASPADLAKLNPADVAKSQDALVLSNAKSGKPNTGGNSSTPDLSSSDITSLPSGKYSVSIDGTDKTFKSKQEAQTAIDYQNFQNSDKNYEVKNGYVFRKDPQGNPSKTSQVKFDYQVGAATLTSQKNAGNVQGWFSTANKQLDNIQKQLQDPSIDPLDALTLQNQAEALRKQIDKYQGYGGFTKPKSAKGGGGFKTASIKTPTIKGISVKSPGTFKAPATRKLSVSKIPSSYVNRKLA